jgi:hypothetical protein
MHSYNSKIERMNREKVIDILTNTCQFQAFLL